MSGDESSCNPPSVVLWLVSGTLKFLRQLEGSRSTPMVGWMSDGGRRKPNIEDSVWNWTSVAHIKVGGVTKAVGMFCTAGLGSLVIPEDPIRRSIGHIINTLSGPLCNPSFGEPHYTVADHLSMHKLHLPVVFLVDSHVPVGDSDRWSPQSWHTPLIYPVSSRGKQEWRTLWSPSDVSGGTRWGSWDVRPRFAGRGWSRSSQIA
ncbi:hypothetical protein MHU86_10304 [Fragilaria crotonensis]|nr:hypothetical protein MHU86_10304 [Fragilaria crotonensis]